MKSITHHPVAALRSLYARAGLHRAHFFALLCCLLLAGGVKAQYTFSTVGTIGNLSASTLDVGDRSTPVLVDLNRDGKLDIVTGNSSGLFRYYQNNGTAKYNPATPGTTNFITTAPNPLSGFDVGNNSTPTFCDIDDDGDLDMFSGSSIGRFRFYKNLRMENGAPFTLDVFDEQFEDDNPLDSDEFGVIFDIGSNSSLGALDTDDDGDLDVVAGNANGQFYFFENQGDETTPYFPAYAVYVGPNDEPTPRPLEASGTNATVGLADFNCDGMYDILSGSRGGGFFFRRLNSATDNFQNFGSTNINNPLRDLDISTNTSDYSFPTFGDLNGDGDQDCISGRANGNFVYFSNETCAAPPTFTGVVCGNTYTVNVDASGTHVFGTGADFVSGASATPGTCSPVVSTGASFVFTPESVDCAQVGTTVSVTLQARDNVTGVKGAPCVVNVTVGDVTLPTANCKTEYVVGVGASNGQLGTVPASAIDNGSTDNCTSSANLLYTVSYSYSSTQTYDCNSDGSTVETLTLTVMDQRGNPASCTTSVVVRDRTAPVPDVTTLPVLTREICNFNGAQFNAGFEIPTPTATDHCYGAASVEVSVDGGGFATPSGNWPASFGTAGTYTLTWRYADAASTVNMSTQTQTLVISANGAPTFSGCPGDMTFYINDGTCAYVLSPFPSDPTPIDCDPPVNGYVISKNYPSTYAFPVGSTILRFSTMDAAGNAGACNVKITVIPALNQLLPLNTSPVSPNPVTALSGQCGAPVTFTVWTPTVSSTSSCANPVSVGLPRVNFSPNNFFAVGTPVASGSFFPVGTTYLDYVATDSKGNPSVIGSISVTVNDLPPSITCPGDITANSDPTYCAAIVFLPNATATDNCPGVSVSPTYGSSYALSPQYSDGVNVPTIISYQALDVNGNVASCSTKVYVRDVTKPVWTNCPVSPASIANTTGTCQYPVSWADPSLFDNCGANVSVEIIHPDLGTYSPNNPYYNNPPYPGAFTNGGQFSEGETTVKYTATDIAGLTALCTFKVKVTDNVPPTVSCPLTNIARSSSLTSCNYSIPTGGLTEITINPGAGSCGTPTLSYRFASNNQPVASSYSFGASQTSYSLIAVATDPSGNAATCPFTLKITDNVAPEIVACPSNIVRDDINGGCGENVTWVSTFHDNCTLDANLSITTNKQSGAFFAAGTTTTVTTTAKDAQNNTSVACTFTVTVNDKTKPTITCPSPIVKQVTNSDPATCGINVTWPASAQDDCSNIQSLGSQYDYYYPNGTNTVSGTFTGFFSVGPPVTVTYQASDNSGNTNTCSFTLTVQDKQGPVIYNCPGDITVNTVNCSGTAVNWYYQGIYAFDACDFTANVGQPTKQPGSNFPPGPTVVQYTSVDNSGNSRVCSFTVSVIVNETTPPTISCSALPTVTVVSTNCINGTLTASLFTQQPTFSDNCAMHPSMPVRIVTTLPVTLPVGPTTITWEAKDAANNVAQCQQNVIIKETVLPAITCVDYTVPVDVPGNQFISSSSSNFLPPTPTATDNCGITLNGNNPVKMNQLPQYPIGISYLSWQATDNAGNTKSCTQKITVNNGPVPPTPAPVFTNCPTAPSVLTVNAANCAATATFTTPSTNPVGLTVNTTGATSPFSGTSTITYTASNSNGTATCIRTVIVNPANVEACTNGVDDDCDGLADGADPDCNGGNPGTCAEVKRLANDGLANDYYGNSVDVHNDLAVVGAYYDDNPGINSGSVYVLDRGVSNTWLQVAKLSPMDGTSSAGDWFGYSVAIDGDYIVVGASEEGSNGAAYVFQKGASSSSWTQVARLTDATGAAGDKFGFSVSISGNYIIVGAPQDETTANINDNHGSVSVFQRSGTVWSLVVKRTASDALPGDAYGSSVSIEGDYAAVGAPLNDFTSRINAGSVYVLRKNAANTWTEIARQHASDYLAYDNYGTSVSLSGSNLLVGSPLNDVSGKANAGSVYVLNQDEGGPDVWGEQENLIASDFTAADQFGISVSLDGDVAAIGAHFDDIHGFHSGSTYLFDGSGGWIQSGKIDDVTGGVDDNFGRSVGISGSTVIVGAWKDNNGSIADQGSAKVFDDCSNTFQAPLDNRSDAPATLIAATGKVLCAPNPATDIINIDVTLVQEEAVRITVCDATGRLLETIFDDKTGVESRFQWDGGRYGRGMYFIRVQSASVNKVVSVTILR